MDIWSLGCCIVQMATGRRPWSALDNEWSVMFHVVTGHPPLPDPSQMSSSGISFLKECFTRNPKERPSAHELLNHPWITNYLEHGIIADDDEEAIPSSPPPSPTNEPVPHLPSLPTPSSSETQPLQQQGSKNGLLDEIDFVASDNDALRVYIKDLVDQQQQDSQPPPPTGDPSV
jgi:mitogen-activated protein kinase kinase kinase